MIFLNLIYALKKILIMNFPSKCNTKSFLLSLLNSLSNLWFIWFFNIWHYLNIGSERLKILVYQHRISSQCWAKFLLYTKSIVRIILILILFSLITIDLVVSKNSIQRWILIRQYIETLITASKQQLCF